MLRSVERRAILGAVVVLSASVTRGQGNVEIDTAFPKQLPPEAVRVLGSSTLRTLQVNRLAFSADAKRLAAATGDTVQLWDATTGKQIAERRRSGDRDRPIGPLKFVDGDRLLVHSDSVDGIVYWNLATFAAEPRTIRNVVQGFAESPLAISADGSRVVSTRPASGLKGRTVIVVRASPAGRALFEQTVLENARAALSPDGKRLAYFFAEQAKEAEQVLVRNLDDGVDSPPLGPFERGVEEVIFAPDGHTAYVVDKYAEVTAWNVETGKKIRTLHPPGRWGIVTASDLSYDGRRLALKAHEGVVVFDTATGAEIRRIPRHPQLVVRAVALSADGTLLATGGDSYVVEIWNVDRGTRHVDPVGHHDYIYAVAAAPDGSAVATIDRDRLLLWSRDGRITASADTLSSGASSEIRLNFTPDGRSIVAMLGKGRIEFRDAKTLATRFAVRRRQPFPVLSAVSPGLEATACVLSGNAVKLQPGPHAVDGPRQAAYRTYAGPERPIVRLEFSFDGAWLAALADDGEFLVWPTYGRNYSLRLKTGAPVSCLAVAGSVTGGSVMGSTITGGSVTGGSVTGGSVTGGSVTGGNGVAGADRRYAATGSSDGVVRLWDLAEQRELRQWTGAATQPRAPTALAFDASMSRLAAGYDDGSVRLLSLEKGGTKTIVPARGKGAAVSRLGWSPDGERLGIGLADEQFRVWPGPVDFADQAARHSGPVTFIGWLDDGKRIGLGRQAGAVVLEADTLKPLRTVEVANGHAVGFGIHPRSRRLRYYRNDGEVFEEPEEGDAGRPVAAFHRVDELHFHDEVRCSALSPDGRTFVATTETALLIWNDPQGPQTSEYRLEHSWQHKVDFSRTSEFVGVRGPGLSLRRVSDGKGIAHLEAPTSDLYFKFHFSPTEDVVALENGDHLRLYDYAKRQPVGDIELPFKNLWEFAFTPDGAQIVALGWDRQKNGELVVVDVAGRKVVHRLKLANRWPRDFASLDGGRSAAVTSGDGLTIIWTLTPPNLGAAAAGAPEAAAPKAGTAAP